MNIGEASNLNTLLRWLFGLQLLPGHVVTEDAAKAALQHLAERACKALSAGMSGRDVAKAWPTLAAVRATLPAPQRPVIDFDEVVEDLVAGDFEEVPVPGAARAAAHEVARAVRATLPTPELEGCGDNSCVIARPRGMGTNGGCSCDVSQLRRAVLSFRAAFAAHALESGHTAVRATLPAPDSGVGFAPGAGDVAHRDLKPNKMRRKGRGG